MTMMREIRGELAYHAGLSAEMQIAKYYTAQGYELLEQRWRGGAGEIDLILANSRCVVFVEVKKARDLATAASRITMRQLQRIYVSAEEYILAMRNPPLEARIDAALVDGTGAFDVIENAYRA
ncbi:MAG: YraN family protein [Arenibacterium sp.]